MTRSRTALRTAAEALVAGAAAAAVVLSLAPAAHAADATNGAELVVTGTVERFLVDDFGADSAGSHPLDD